MVYQVIDDPLNFSSAAFIGTLAERWGTQQRLLGDKHFPDWQKLSLRCADSSLPEPDFMFLNLTGLFMVKYKTIKNVQDFFVGCEFLPVLFNDEDWLIIKPPSCVGYIDADESIISYEDIERPKINTPVFILDIPPVPWLFRVQHSIFLYTTDGAGSFFEWYRNSGLTGLKFPPQKISKGLECDEILHISESSEDDFEEEELGSSLINSEHDENVSNFNVPLNALNLQDEEDVVFQHLVATFDRFRAECGNVRVSAIGINFNIDPGGYNIHINSSEKYLYGLSDRMKYANFAWLVRDQWYNFNRTTGSSECRLTTYTGDILEYAPLQDGYKLTSGCAKQYESDVHDGGHLIMALGEFLTIMMHKLISQGVFNEWNLVSNARFYVHTSGEEFYTPVDEGYSGNIINNI